LDQLAGEQVAARHHVADGFAVGGADFRNFGGEGIVTEAAPGPAHQRPGHYRVGGAEGDAAQAIGQGGCHHTRSRLGMQIAWAALPPIVTLFTLVRLSAPARYVESTPSAPSNASGGGSAPRRNRRFPQGSSPAGCG